MSKPFKPIPPTLKELLRQYKQDIFSTFNSHQIGIIEEFDPANQTATVRFAIKRVLKTNKDGSKVLSERPLVKQAPVVMLYGGSSYLTFPIAPGDECIVLFNDREIDNWFTQGAAQNGLPPQTERMHDVSDALILVGVRSLRKSIANYLENGIRLAFSADVKIEMTEDEIQSYADLFTHNGDFLVEGNMAVAGNLSGKDGDALNINSDIIQEGGKTLAAGNGATGTFNTVTVENGIVTGGS
jgi:hypothetical protein